MSIWFVRVTLTVRLTGRAAPPVGEALHLAVQARGSDNRHRAPRVRARLKEILIVVPPKPAVAVRVRHRREVAHRRRRRLVVIVAWRDLDRCESALALRHVIRARRRAAVRLSGDHAADRHPLLRKNI